MHDLSQFVEEPIEFAVEFQGKTLVFYVKPVTLEAFFGALKGVPSGAPAMRKTFREFLLDDEQVPVTKEWVDDLLKKPALVPLGLKISDGINAALGINELAGKKG